MVMSSFLERTPLKKTSAPGIHPSIVSSFFSFSLLAKRKEKERGVEVRPDAGERKTEISSPARSLQRLQTISSSISPGVSKSREMWTRGNCLSCNRWKAGVLCPFSWRLGAEKRTKHMPAPQDNDSPTDNRKGEGTWRVVSCGKKCLSAAWRLAASKTLLSSLSFLVAPAIKKETGRSREYTMTRRSKEQAGHRWLSCVGHP